MSANRTMGAPLRQLARLHGVQTRYRAFSGQMRECTAAGVLEALKLLGAPIGRFEDVADAVRATTLERWRTVVEPVIVVHPPEPGGFEVRIPAERSADRLHCVLRLEGGSERKWTRHLGRLADERAARPGASRFVAKRVALPAGLPHGYHELVIELAGRTHRSLVVAAPQRAWAPGGRGWGAFLPLYAMHSAHSRGAGDFSDLARFRDWIGQRGGSVVSVLPLLASFLDEPFDPSPYAPASRLFWNEFYVDPRRAPELAACPAAQRLLASDEMQREVAAHRAAPQVDYRREYAMRRLVLQELARSLVLHKGPRYDAWREHLAAHPSLDDYAAFRAVVERRRAGWSEWPEPLRSGTISTGDHDADAKVCHLYAQWLAEEQLAAFSSAAPRSGPGLYLDFPLGVHGDGYDPWRFRDVFVAGASGGAPPDEVFTQGQDWAFPPLHPEHIRRQGYRYVIDCVRHQLGHATFLRIDHVMGLHRLYWMPKGGSARDGVYVQYRSDELYAILCLESHRHRAGLVGENLGTVPPQVNTALARHGVNKMYVVQYEARPDAARPLRPVPAASVASLNTHDMPPFAAYLRGLDFQDRLALGLLRPSQLGAERKTRRRIREAMAQFLHRRGFAAAAAPDDEALMRGVLAWLAASPAGLLLVNIEDLWLETELQNLPGTGLERPNWRRKARRSLEDLQHDAAVTDLLRSLGRLRAHGKARVR